jgi:hypothetical protein
MKGVFGDLPLLIADIYESYYCGHLPCLLQPFLIYLS